MSHIEIQSERCKGCELCAASCPIGVIVMSSSFNSLGYFPARPSLNGERSSPPKHAWALSLRRANRQSDNGCTGCAICARMCPEVAITVFR